MALNNAIKFLRGSQDNLNTLITTGGASEGAFYLTSDTQRLYIGKTVNGKVIPVSVNQGVVTVAALADLPGGANNLTGVKTPGEFYYVTALNALCVYNGSEWVQVNPQFDPTELQNAINSINEAIGGINATVEGLGKDKMDKSGGTFTNKVYGVTPEAGKAEDKLALVTRDYVDTAVSGLTDGSYATVKYVDDEIDGVEQQISGLSGTLTTVSGVANAADTLSKANATLIGTLDTEKTSSTTVVGYIDEVKDTADKAAKASDVETTVNGINETISGIEQTLGEVSTVANDAMPKAGGNFTGDTLTKKGVDIATVADIDAAKTALIGGATAQTLKAIEDAHAGDLAAINAQFAEIKGNVENLANVMTFVGVTTTEITDGNTTKTIQVNDKDYTADIGDVVIYDGEEFVWDGSAWKLFGSASATTAALEALEGQITDNKNAYDAYVIANDKEIAALKEADSGFSQALSELGTTVTNNNTAFETYKTTNDKAVSDNTTAIGGLTTTVNGLVETSATKEELAGETAARTNAVNDIVAQLTWGSFDPAE